MKNQAWLKADFILLYALGKINGIFVRAPVPG